MKKKGFTLIELLIVVAIIAILAAIAVPNFLEAQVRAKVSRAKSDLRSLATAMEAYVVDYNKYPPSNTFGVAVNNAAVGGTNDYTVLERLSTPVAFITSSIIPDAFDAAFRTGSNYTGQGGQPGLTIQYDPNPEHPAYHSYQYTSTGNTGGGGGEGGRALGGPQGSDPAIPATAWGLSSAGPDRIYINMGGVQANSNINSGNSVASMQDYVSNLLYDTTNGTNSFGEIYRVGGEIGGNNAHFFYVGVAQQR